MSKKPDINERLARLETREELISEQQESITRKLDTLNARFDKYEARWGGVVMVVSALAALVLTFKSEIIRLFRGQ